MLCRARHRSVAADLPDVASGVCSFSEERGIGRRSVVSLAWNGPVGVSTALLDSAERRWLPGRPSAWLYRAAFVKEQSTEHRHSERSQPRYLAETMGAAAPDS